MSKAHKLVVKLKGGLGNQMFQYATAFAVAARNGMALVTDVRSGFARDRTYRRNFSLKPFALAAPQATALERAPFVLESLIRRCTREATVIVKRRPWGIHIEEATLNYHPELLAGGYDQSMWLDGHWQTERYFEAFAPQVAQTFQIRAPEDRMFLSLAEDIRQQNAVAVGIRLYEEAPSGAHDAAPFSFYTRAAHELWNDVEKPVFYLFCTIRSPIYEKLSLPGEIRYVTHDDGYLGELSRLWLLTRFKYHIISNSSFYWWGAWLAERNMQNAKIFACDLFPNPDTIPRRWSLHSPLH